MNLTLSKPDRSRIIQFLSYLAFIYAGLGFFNQNFFHWTRSFWLSGYSEKIAIVVFGIWRVTQEKNPYTRRRIAVLVFFITTIWILFPYLTGSSFFNHHVIGSAWFFVYLVIIFFFGRRADCSWNCPCVGIRDTAGDVFRPNTIKGGWLWKLRHIKWIFLASLVIYFILNFSAPNSLSTLIYARNFMTVNMGFYFASLLVIPWTGNRNYCRYLCPWGSLYGLIGKIGFFKIVADQEACFDCDICDEICDMGVRILALIQEKGEINEADCVGCGRCVQACPTEALHLVDVRDALKAVVVR